MPPQSSVTTHYRPDIDGLRAIAVMSVVLFHAGFPLFSGGFVGVDIFFVISGFLITRLLVDEVATNTHVNYRRFYLRRARRLLPAMLFTLAVTAAFSIGLLSPLQLQNVGASLVSAVLTVPNIFFYTDSGYFAADASLKPLLHTWSLGVEEQFYYLWPMLIGMFALYRWGPPLLTAVAGLVSLYFCQRLMAGNPDASFFLMPLRVYEFAIGALLVWTVRSAPLRYLLPDLLLAIGLALIAYSVVTYDEHTAFPGVNALVPCIGAALCIYAGQAGYMGKLLSNRLSVGIGLISYSLYLAHWPIMVFYKHSVSGGQISPSESIALTLCSLAVAVCMYFFIETPFRKSRENNARFLVTCAVIALLLLCLGASLWGYSGWTWRSWAASGDIAIETIEAGKKQRFDIRRKHCRQKGWDNCDDLVPGNVNALVLGDSHAVDALNGFDAAYPQHNFSMSSLAGCPPHNDIEAITIPSHPNRSACKALNLTRFDAAYLQQFDYIVINILLGWYTVEQLEEYLLFLHQSGIEKVIVLGDYLELSTEMYELINQYGYSPAAVIDRASNPAGSDSQLRPLVEQLGYLFVSKREVFCHSGTCQVFDDNNVPFTYDTHHLSLPFATRIVTASKKQVDAYLDHAWRTGRSP
jgi:peptidoglycan/LPS O-acetylase OafA/YrhL